jgi:hypothetical protein
MAIGVLLKDLLIAGGTAAVQGIIRLLRGKQRPSLPEVDVTVSEPPHPRFPDLEHQRRQIAGSVAASKAAEAMKRRSEERIEDDVDRAASTSRPPPRKPGRLGE